MPINYKKDDQLPGAEFTIARADGGALGFVEADVDSVTLIAREVGSSTPAFQYAIPDADWSINGGGTAIEGTYFPEAEHTADPAKFDIEIRVVVDGKPITFPNDQHGRMNVVGGLYVAP